MGIKNDLTSVPQAKPPAKQASEESIAKNQETDF